MDFKKIKEELEEGCDLYCKHKEIVAQQKQIGMIERLKDLWNHIKDNNEKGREDTG